MDNINVVDLIKSFNNMGIKLWIDNKKLRYKAPKALLSDLNLKKLKDNKEAIINYLNEKGNEIILEEDIEGKYEPFLMTDIQSAYALGRKDTFKFGGVACHIYMEIKYDNLELSRVKEIWNKLIYRHDMLRAVMNENGYQKIIEKVPELNIFYIDLRDENNKNELENLRKNLSNKVYEIGKWPMFDVGLTKGKNEDILHISIEFLIADWKSIWTLLSEFESLYFHPEKKLSPIKVSFRDYVLSERKLKETGKYENDKQYWMDQLENFYNAPDLPLNTQKLDNEINSFKRFNLNLNSERWKMFKERAKKIGITPTAAVLTVYASVIERWSNNKEFCLNLTVLNRLPLHPDIDKVVGDFTSISLLNIDNMETSFLEKAKNINTRLFENLDHRLYSGIEVIRDLIRNKGRENALMPIVFTSAIGLLHSDEKDLIGKITDMGITQTPQVFIDCQAMDGNFGLEINWDVREGVFPQGMIEDMFNTFEKRLIELSDCSEEWTKKSKLILPDMQLEERKAVNNTKKDLDEGMLFSKFRKMVKDFPNNLAVTDGYRSYNYAELDRKAKDIAWEIQKQGGKIQDKIAILMDKSVYQVASVLGILYMGGVYVPLDSKNPNQRVNNIINNSDVKIVLTASNSLNNLNENLTIINVDLLDENKDFIPVESAINLPAYIIYTSGSTGIPKGVVISHEAAMNTIEDINEKFHICEKDRVLGLSQLNFDLSVYDIFGMLSKGGAIVYPNKERYSDPSHWIELIEKYNITIWNSVPAFMEILLPSIENLSEKYIIASLRLALLSGDWIPLEMPNAIKNCLPKCKVISLGGATEAGIWSIFYEYEKLNPDWVSIPYGKPLSNQQFYVLDNKMRDCPTWVPGELYISGKGLANGYYNDEKLTNSRFLEGIVKGSRIYKTGDMGRYLPNGEIEFLGRKDNQIKLHGHRIELGEIENAINSYSAAKMSVANVNSQSVDKEIYSFVETRNIENFDVNISKNNFNKLTNGIETSSSKLVEKIEEVGFDNFIKWRDNAALTSILYSLQALGYFVDNKGHKIQDILQCKEILEKYHWLVRYWILKLERENYLYKENDRYYNSKGIITKDKLELCFKFVRDNWKEEFGSVDFLNYLEENEKNLNGLLSGKVDPVSILYPQGKLNYTQALYVKNTMSIYLNQCIAEFVRRVIMKNPNEKIRILEIGAGTGATTESVLSKITGLKFEYYYTDSLKYFMPAAKNRFGHRKEMKFAKLNIDMDYREQGFSPNSFDIIIGAYVLENAKDIKKSLKKVEELLAPQGYFVFSEPIKEEPWILASQAFMMTKPEDDIRSDVAFIDCSGWIELLNSQYKNSNVKVIPEYKSNILNMGVGLFIKQFKVDKVKIREKEIMKFISSYLPDYMLPSSIQIIDSFPLNNNGKINYKMLSSWKVKKNNYNLYTNSETDNNYTELDKKLMSIWKNILKVDSIGKKQNFYDFGADSLIMAQATAKIREVLDFNIPFDLMLRQMLNYPTIKELSKFIESKKEEEVNKIKFDNTDVHVSETKSLVDIKKYSNSSGKFVRILLHGIQGTLSPFEYLASRLLIQNKGDVIGIGINDVDKYCSLKSENIITYLANEYTEAVINLGVKNVQIIGHSFGGLIAVEMACRLSEKGINIKDISIIDSEPIPFKIEDDLMMEILFADSIGVYLKDLGFKYEDNYEKILSEYLFKGNDSIPNGFLTSLDNDVEKGVGDFFKNMSKYSQEKRFELYNSVYENKTGKKLQLEMIKKMFIIFSKTITAMQYTPTKYFGDIRYFGAKEREGLYKYKNKLSEKWKDICLGDFSVYEVQGNHYTCINNQLYTRALAEKLGEILK